MGGGAVRLGARAIFAAMLKDAIPLGEVARGLVVMLRHHGDGLLPPPGISVLTAHPPCIEIAHLVCDDTAPMLQGPPALHGLHTVGRRWKGEAAISRIASEAR